MGRPSPAPSDLRMPAYGEGIDAGHAWWRVGGDVPANPYPPETPDFDAWDLGFCHGSGDAEAGEEPC